MTPSPGGKRQRYVYGDNNTVNGFFGLAQKTERESLEWDKAPDPHDTSAVDINDNLAAAFVKDTGNVNVDLFSVNRQSNQTPETNILDGPAKGASITGDDQADMPTAPWHRLANQDGEKREHIVDFSKECDQHSSFPHE